MKTKKGELLVCRHSLVESRDNTPYTLLKRGNEYEVLEAIKGHVTVIKIKDDLGKYYYIPFPNIYLRNSNKESNDA
jgi:hypothetical protein